MIEQRDACPGSGFRPGASYTTAKGRRRGWCSHCEQWRPVTGTGKFKRHKATPKP